MSTYYTHHMTSPLSLDPKASRPATQGYKSLLVLVLLTAVLSAAAFAFSVLGEPPLPDHVLIREFVSRLESPVTNLDGVVDRSVKSSSISMLEDANLTVRQDFARSMRDAELVSSTPDVRTYQYEVRHGEASRIDQFWAVGSPGNSIIRFARP